MVATNKSVFSAQQIADYQEQGYLILRNVLSRTEADDLRKLTRQELDRLSFPASLRYPAPGKYTISGNNFAEPGFASVVDHPTVVDAVECLLGEPAHLTAYVAYLRSPGDKGSGAHCDYKRWRPVGSSMNWLFAIIPLTDFSAGYGPLLVSPGSHKLLDVFDKSARIWDVSRPDAKQLPDFIDPDLQAGDLLLLHGGTWHKAPAGTTQEDRAGIFNKYCGISSPPAAGYYPYNRAAYEALSDQGKHLIPGPSDKPILTTRLLIEDAANGESRYLVQEAEGGTGLQLPGGVGWEEENAGWDVGARIGSLQSLAQEELGVEVPWMSYIDDVDEGEGRCRLYGHVDPELDSVSFRSEQSWLTEGELLGKLGESDPICHAVQSWKREGVIRGKGKAISQSKKQFE